MPNARVDVCVVHAVHDLNRKDLPTLRRAKVINKPVVKSLSLCSIVGRPREHVCGREHGAAHDAVCSHRRFVVSATLSYTKRSHRGCNKNVAVNITVRRRVARVVAMLVEDVEPSGRKI